jgi:hypothetical protein
MQVVFLKSHSPWQDSNRCFRRRQRCHWATAPEKLQTNRSVCMSKSADKLSILARNLTWQDDSNPSLVKRLYLFGRSAPTSSAGRPSSPRSCASRSSAKPFSIHFDKHFDKKWIIRSLEVFIRNKAIRNSWLFFLRFKSYS